MRLFPRNNKGETLAETLVALMVLGIGITVASTVISSSIQNMENTYNRILAVNLAREGLEAVHNIRETNWMKFSNDKRGCWNHLPQPLDLNGNEACTPSTEAINTSIKQGSYVVYLDKDKRWRLREIPPEAAEELPKLYRLKVITDPATNEGYEIINPIDPGLVPPLNNLGETPDPSASTKDSFLPFKRTLTLKYIDDSGAVATGIGSEKVNRLEVTSEVTWKRNGQDFKVELKNRLSDYLGRSNLEE